MQLHRSGCRFLILAGILVVSQIAGPTLLRAEKPPVAASRSGAPATVAEAAKVLDLATFPLPEGAAEPQCRRLACLTYNAQGKVAEVFALLGKQLIGQRWQQLPDAQATGQVAGGTFARDGFLLAVSVYSVGTPGVVSVAITHLGNVDLEKLPVPGKARLVFPGPASVAFLTDMPAEKATLECRKLLLAQGWQPYGTAGDTLVLKQNAVRLTARIVAATGQGGKTMVSYSAALMSADLPAPADAKGVQYNELTTELGFDTKAAPRQIIDFYRQTLGKAGWEATTDRPLKDDDKQMLLLRNPSHDLLTLELYEVDDQTRVRVKHQTAAEIAELERQLEDKAKDNAKSKAKPDG